VNHPAIIHQEWYDNDHKHRDPYALQDRNLEAWWRQGGDSAELDGLPLQEAPAQEELDSEPNVLAGDNDKPDNQEQDHDQNNKDGNQIAVFNQIEADTQAYELWPRLEVLKDIGLKDRIKDKGHKGQHFVCPLRKGQ
jgi:hypothetical protein